MGPADTLHALPATLTESSVSVALTRQDELCAREVRSGAVASRPAFVYLPWCAHLMECCTVAPGAPPPPPTYVVAQRTCADTDADGTADYFDCSSDANDLGFTRGAGDLATGDNTECAGAPIDCSEVDATLPCHIMFLFDEVRFAQSLSDIDPQIYCPCKLVRDGALDWNPEATSACSGTGNGR